MENKIITIYELMGLIKDGKAPKKIKCNDINYQTNEIEWFTLKMFELNHLEKALNTKIEILPEENNEWKDIKEIEDNYNTVSLDEREDIFRAKFNDNSNIFACRIDLLIKNQKYLKEKLESKDE